ncbi:FMN-binding protein [Actinoplanes sp. CA-030573]|uniref:FMN-binding protein n=1 Tax=Actinoplanes sp. CA-030573 TaxID=3239898 RepID=UPI003D92D057
MRRITLWLFSTVAAVVLLFSYRTSTAGSSGPAVAATAPASLPQGGGKTYTGNVAQTRWGPVQVSITVSGGRITDVGVPTYPSNNGRDVEINSRALPILRQETLEKQSADIDAVSGATVTSDGYRQSLQSALDAAHRN